MHEGVIERVIRGCVVASVLGCTAGDFEASGPDADSTGTATGDPPPDDPTEQLAPGGEVDILFVIDNSPTMAMAQNSLVNSAQGLLERLEAPDVQADYRIAVTTAESGNPGCTGAGLVAERGDFVLESCVDRSDFAGTSDPRDQCGRCSKHDVDMQIQLTPTALEGPAPRRWVQRIGGASNIEGATAEQALACYLPQGSAGCEFASPLASMVQALDKSAVPGSPNYGFLRETAQLVVVLVSDRADCSHNPAAAEIFTSNPVFWTADGPTRGLCWRAGVACSGGPGEYDECHADNHDLGGAPGAADGDAVLEPVGVYIDYLNAIAQAKQVSAARPVKVLLISGVPWDLGAGDPLEYADSPDPEIQEEFGIGLGCQISEPDSNWMYAAAPPVRERELAEAFAGDGPNVRSICAGSYEVALAALAEEIVADF